MRLKPQLFRPKHWLIALQHHLFALQEQLFGLKLRLIVPQTELIAPQVRLIALQTKLFAPQPPLIALQSRLTAYAPASDRTASPADRPATPARAAAMASVHNSHAANADDPKTAEPKITTKWLDPTPIKTSRFSTNAPRFPGEGVTKSGARCKFANNLFNFHKKIKSFFHLKSPPSQGALAAASADGVVTVKTRPRNTRINAKRMQNSKCKMQNSQERQQTISNLPPFFRAFFAHFAGKKQNLRNKQPRQNHPTAPAHSEPQRSNPQTKPAREPNKNQKAPNQSNQPSCHFVSFRGEKIPRASAVNQVRQTSV